MDSRYDLGPWACTMKLCDVRTNPGLMRGHGLIPCIRGWAYPRDSTVVRHNVMHEEYCRSLAFGLYNSFSQSFPLLYLSLIMTHPSWVV